MLVHNERLEEYMQSSENVWTRTSELGDIAGYIEIAASVECKNDVDWVKHCTVRKADETREKGCACTT